MAGNGKEFERVNIGSEVLNEYPVPNLVEIQTSSYKDFLQLDKIMNGQEPDEELGLEHLFRTYFPIESPNHEMKIEYAGYIVDPNDVYAMKSETECKRKGSTFGVPVKVKIRLEKRNGEIQEKEIFFGEFPVMTDRGTFIINGSERVIVTSIVSSPGVICKSMNKKERLVAAIENGTVIDHIPADKTSQVTALLKLNELTEPVTIGNNYPSEKLGKKGIIKVSDKFFSDEEISRLSVVSPKVVLNIIKDFEVVEKKTVETPDELRGIILCNNPKCITNNEPMQTYFTVEKLTGLVRCHYCDKEQDIRKVKLC